MGEVSPASPSRLRLQLAGRLRRAFALYCLPWSSVDAEVIIQGSGIGPAVHVVNVSDQKVMTPGNQLCKFTNDTYLLHHPSQQRRLAVD